MEHIDAKAVRDRLNRVALTLGNLEPQATAAEKKLIADATAAVREIAVLIFGDEREEHGEAPPAGTQRDRERIRDEEQGEGGGAGSKRKTLS